METDRTHFIYGHCSVHILVQQIAYVTIYQVHSSHFQDLHPGCQRPLSPCPDQEVLLVQHWDHRPRKFPIIQGRCEGFLRKCHKSHFKIPPVESLRRKVRILI